MDDVRIAVQIQLSAIHPFSEPRPHSLSQGEDFPTLVGFFMSCVIVLIFFKRLVAGTRNCPYLHLNFLSMDLFGSVFGPAGGRARGSRRSRTCRRPGQNHRRSQTIARLPVADKIL